MHGEVQIPHFQLITLISYRTVMIMDPAGAGVIICGMIVVFLIYSEINYKIDTVYH